MAGCVLAVRFSSSSGPSKQSRESANPSVVSASSNTARAAGDASQRVFPIPTNWEPCPGKRRASFPISWFLFPSPPQEDRAPHQSGAEGGQQDEVAGLHAVGLHAFIQRDR